MVPDTTPRNGLSSRPNTRGARQQGRRRLKGSKRGAKSDVVDADEGAMSETSQESGSSSMEIPLSPTGSTHHHRGEGVPFPVKLYELVNDPKVTQLRWTEDGLAFRFKFNDQFRRSLTSSGFRATLNMSFIRQLNLYGFRSDSTGRRRRNGGGQGSSDDDADVKTYSHQFFKANHPDLLAKILRPNQQQAQGSLLEGHVSCDGCRARVEALEQRLQYLEAQFNRLSIPAPTTDYNQLGYGPSSPTALPYMTTPMPYGPAIPQASYAPLQSAYDPTTVPQLYAPHDIFSPHD